MRNQPLSKRMQKFRILQRAVFIQCLHEKFIDWLGLHEWAEQSEGFLGGAARFVVVVGEVDDEADEVGLDLVVEEGLAGAVAKAVHRTKESNRGAANVGIRLEGREGRVSEGRKVVKSGEKDIKCDQNHLKIIHKK